MSNRELKQQRTRLVFAETAKEMILTDGIDTVSVRKIAERAGYSLGTLYNHFNNLDELLWLTRSLLIKDIAMENLSEKVSLEKPEDLAQSYKIYIRYYIKNPNVFRFFYFYKLQENHRTPEEESYGEFLEQEIQNTCNFIALTGGYSADKSRTIYKTFTYAVHGMLMLAITGNDNLEMDHLNTEIDELVTLFFDTQEE